MKYVGDHDIWNIELTHIDKFKISLKKSGLSNVTINLRLSKLKRFLNWFKERNPEFEVPAWQKLTEKKKIPQVLTADNLARIIEWISRNRSDASHNMKTGYKCLERFLFAVIGTGARRSEIYYLKWRDIDLEKGLITVRARQDGVKLKDDKLKAMPVFLNEYLVNEKRCYPGEEYLLDNGKGEIHYSSPKIVTNTFNKIFKNLGIRGRIKPVHGFRSGYATMLKDIGVDVHTIQQLMGHKNIETTLGYFSNVDVAQITAIGKLNEEITVKFGRKIGTDSLTLPQPPET